MKWMQKTMATLVAGLLIISAAPVDAALVTVGSLTIDDANTLDQGADVSGTHVTASGYTSPTGMSPNVAHSVGNLIAGYGAAGIDLNAGSSTARGIIELSYSGGALQNVSGYDLYVGEQGSSTAPEAFMVRLYKNNSTWTSWRYEYADEYSGTLFLTAFDFTDFGLTGSDTVAKIEIANLINTDSMTTANTHQGDVTLGGNDSSSWPYGGPFATDDGVPNHIDYTSSHIPDGKYDADIALVFYTSAVPEPSTYALMGLGAVMMGWAIRRRRAAQAVQA